jgi:hypothetical protein
VIVVLVPADYTPGKARAALAAGRAVPPDARPYECAVFPGPDLPDLPPPPEGEAGADAIQRVVLDRHVRRDGIFLAAGLAKVLGRALARRPAAIALDGSGPVWMLLDGHGLRVGEVPQVVARALFWQKPPRPVVIHFCPREMYGCYSQEWLRILTLEPIEDRQLLVDTPQHRLRFHHEYANAERERHHPKARARRILLARWRRLTGRLAFWR